MTALWAYSYDLCLCTFDPKTLNLLELFRLISKVRVYDKLLTGGNSLLWNSSKNSYSQLENKMTFLDSKYRIELLDVIFVSNLLYKRLRSSHHYVLEHAYIGIEGRAKGRH